MPVPNISTVEVSECPVCRNRSSREGHPATTDRWFGVSGSWSYVQCESCQSLWLAARPTEEALLLVYANYFTHANAGRTPEASAPSRGDGIRRSLPWHRNDRRGEMAYLDGRAPGRVLDVGCGNGARLAALARAGWNIVGVDFDADAVNAATLTRGTAVSVGTIHDVEESAGFDAVVMFHVFEHLPDLPTTLSKAMDLLRPGGLLVIVTPNVGSWMHRMYGGLWRGLEPPRHFQIFSVHGLQRLLTKAGFDPVEVFTTERNAATMALMSETGLASASAPRRILARLKAEGLQAAEWAWLHRSGTCGEEIVAMATAPLPSSAPRL